MIINSTQAPARETEDNYDLLTSTNSSRESPINLAKPPNLVEAPNQVRAPKSVNASYPVEASNRVENDQSI